MIMLIIYWLYVSGVIFLYGVFFEQVLRHFFQLKKIHSLHLSYTMISGLVCLSMIGTWFSIFYRLNIEFNILLLIGAIPIALFYKSELIRRKKVVLEAVRNTPWTLKFIFIFVVIIASLGSCVDSLWNYDHGMYYVQYVKWIENYAVVKGLGNIRPHFAYNSTWHILTAIFSFSFLDNTIKFNDLNGLLWIFMVLCSLRGLNKILKNNASFSDYFTVFMPLPIYIMRYYFNAAFADFTIICLIFMMLSLLIQTIEQKQWGKITFPNLFIGIVSFFMVTVKLSAVPILIPTFVLIFILLRQQKYIDVLKAGGIILLFVTPWLLRYYYISGYLVFPFHQLDLFNPDWKMNAGTSIYLQSEIESRSKVPDFQYPILKVLNYEAPFQWISEWFNLMKYYDKFVIISFVISWVSFCLVYLYQIIKQKSLKQTYFLVFLTILGGLLFWFFKAPSPRFGYGWLFSFLFFACAFILYFLQNRLQKLPYICLIIIMLWSVKVSYDSFNELYCFASDCFQLREKPKTPRAEAHIELFKIIFGKTPKTRVPKLTSYQLNGITFYMPYHQDIYRRGLCWDAPLPCFAYEMDWIELRGESLQDGFRLKGK